MLPIVAAGIPTTREPSMSKDEALLIWWDKKIWEHIDDTTLTGVLMHSFGIQNPKGLCGSIKHTGSTEVTDRLKDSIYLHHP